MARRGGLERASTALATADGVAHAAFFLLYGWRVITSFGPGKAFSAALAAMALLGLGLSFVGALLVKHGRRTPAAKVGHWAVAGSTGIAALLLLCAA